MASLCGLHDIESAAIAPNDTWVVSTVALSDNPQPKTYPAHLNVITRLNHGYGWTGTLPDPEQYNWFAQKVAAYVHGSRNCRRWQIGNESNLKREWPDHQPIFPWHYAACYKLCREAIHAIPGHEYDDVLIAGSGPWNAELKYDSNPDGDWIKYFTDVIDLCTPALDGFAIHAYTHSYDAALVTSTARMDSPFQNRYYEFKTYQDYCKAIPADLHHLPVYITEANGDGPWQATGLMPAMLAEINDWNFSQQPKIHCVVFYRYPKYDHFYIEGRDDVLNEYRNAVSTGYQSPDAGTPQPPVYPEPPPGGGKPPVYPEPPPGGGTDYLVEWDARLDQRGTVLGVVQSNALTEWHVRVGRWYDKAQAGGRVNVFVSVLDEDGNLLPGVPVSFVNGGKETKLTEIKYDPWLGHEYSLDFAMYNVAPAYSLQIDDEEPTDLLSGLGLGDLENPHHTIHTSYFFEFQRLPNELPAPPPHTEYVLPVLGANLRAAPVDGLILAELPYRTAVTVVNETATQSDGYMWHGVNYQSHYGFIRSDLLDVRQPDAIVQPPEPEPTPGDGKLIWPVRGAIISQRFGERYEYYMEQFRAAGHNGMDFALPLGSPIFATADGVVDVVEDDRPGYGLYCRIFHPGVRLGSLYAHCSEILVSEGQRVTQGQQIALVGSTGNSTGNHLHYELCAQDVSGGYVNVSYGHTRGRANPEIIMFLIGMPPTYD